MIALDTNVLVRFVVADDPEQAHIARALLEDCTGERPAFVCREVIVEVVWVLEKTYRFSRNEIATLLDEMVGTEGLEVEMASDVARAASKYRRGGAGFSDHMIAAAARRSGAEPLYTFDRKLAQVEGVALLETPAA